MVVGAALFDEDVVQVDSCVVLASKVVGVVVVLMDVPIPVVAFVDVTCIKLEVVAAVTVVGVVVYATVVIVMPVMAVPALTPVVAMVSDLVEYVL